MIVWRLTRAPFAALDGEGARLAGGRWTPKGYPAVYTTSSMSLALLEVVANLEIDLDDDPLIPTDYVSLKIDVPAQLQQSVETVETLPAMTDRVAFQQIGFDWLERGEALFLRVPSVIVPIESNWIINPRHPMATHVKVIEVAPFDIDTRLVI